MLGDPILAVARQYDLSREQEILDVFTLARHSSSHRQSRRKILNMKDTPYLVTNP